MTVTEAQLIAALETLKSAVDADTTLPGTATVWSELWNAAACGLQVAMDNEFHNLGGSEVPDLPAGDQFMGAAKVQAAVLSGLFSIAMENEPQGTWGAQIRPLPLLPGREEPPGNGQLHSAFHILQAADAVLTDDRGLSSVRKGSADETAHHLDVARHYVELLSEDASS
ncbi:hypothetical protein ACGFR6_27600 [Streptomyces sp. NPDC048567]|uniref:hypothetical protein n=1 Tax=Streptomyces sp. NPDC048567 TaxID=3365570 RepID=UPI0037172F1C